MREEWSRGGGEGQGRERGRMNDGRRTTNDDRRPTTDDARQMAGRGEMRVSRRCSRCFYLFSFSTNQHMAEECAMELAINVPTSRSINLIAVTLGRSRHLVNGRFSVRRAVSNDVRRSVWPVRSDQERTFESRSERLD